jgi:predicted lipoprotein with Yx(FWY)xxD motif
MRALLLTTAVLATAATAIGFASPAAGGRSSSTEAARSKPKPTITVRKSAYGRVLFDSRGRALYAFTRDKRRGPSRCYGACAAAWPVYFAKGKLRAGKGVKQRLIGSVRRRNGKRQVTYNGQPLYFYVGDRKRGEIRCQNVVEFGGTWLVVRPNGRLVR